jgi:hypothetical protein
MNNRTALFLLGLVLVALCVGLATRWGANQGLRAGSADGEKSLRRLQLVWPDVLQMPDGDRLVLTELAMQCRLHEKPLTAQDAVQCLTSAASTDDRHRATLSRLLPSEFGAGGMPSQPQGQ